MQKPGSLCLAILTLVMVAGVAAQQKPASLRIDGLVEKQGTFDAKSLAGLKRLTLKVDDHGEPAVYEGVSLTEVLALAGAPVGEKMRGAQLSLVVVAKAADDYVVTYSLAELDPGFTDRVAILADRRDGKPLAENAAPFQIIVPGEKKHGRWIRQVVSLTVKETR
jgi:DMSO/TMAO reductase YedYZ molybdopterin-dependent catalytic subunit